jgi:hypothetical protein
MGSQPLRALRPNDSEEDGPSLQRHYETICPFGRLSANKETLTVRSVSGKLESGTFQSSSASKCPHFTETQLMAALALLALLALTVCLQLVKADVNPPAV